jgi:hypothetical protein
MDLNLNEVLSIPQQYILASDADINLFMAGMGSGKTYLGGIISTLMVNSYPEIKGFIGANTYGQLNTSTMYRIRWVWENLFNYQEGVDYVIGVKPPDTFETGGHYFERYNDIISFKHGAVIFQGSLENSKSHEGKEFAWAILDETKDSREEDIKEVILMRLRERGMVNSANEQWNPLYILTSPAKVQWINDWFNLDKYENEIKQHIYSGTDFFHKEFDNKCIAISATHWNQKNLPENYIENKRFDLTDEQFNRMIYGDPFMKTGGEFYSSFRRAEHVSDTMIIKGHPFHISFDQNVVPYITATLWQAEEREGIIWVYGIDEFCLENPRNKTDKLCEAITDRYGDELSEGGLFYYGDASGRHRDTRGMENDYDLVERVFAKYIGNYSNRVLRANPSVNKRRNFINRILENKLPIRLVVNPKMKNTIADFEYLKETPEGTKYKQTVRDDKNGVSYEKYGHCSDSVDYLLCSMFKQFYKE